MTRGFSTGESETRQRASGLQETQTALHQSPFQMLASSERLRPFSLQFGSISPLAAQAEEQTVKLLVEAERQNIPPILDDRIFKLHNTKKERVMAYFQILRQLYELNGGQYRPKDHTGAFRQASLAFRLIEQTAKEKQQPGDNFWIKKDGWPVFQHLREDQLEKTAVMFNLKPLPSQPDHFVRTFRNKKGQLERQLTTDPAAAGIHSIPLYGIRTAKELVLISHQGALEFITLTLHDKKITDERLRQGVPQAALEPRLIYTQPDSNGKTVWGEDFQTLKTRMAAAGRWSQDNNAAVFIASNWLLPRGADNVNLHPNHWLRTVALPLYRRLAGLYEYATG